MENYSRNVEIRWSDLDPNFHLRHSVFYDWGAFLRICFLNEHQLSPKVLMENNFGPIVFREECVFKKEVLFGDIISVNLQLQKSRRDGSRWTMLHEVWKNETTLAAILTIDGAWMDTTIRKLTKPPEIVLNTFEIIPKTIDFQWID